MTSKVKARIERLKEYDEFLRNEGDEDTFDIWLSDGIPDGEADDIDILQEIAEDDEEFFRISLLFDRLVDLD